jgi:hypothetical protein
MSIRSSIVSALAGGLCALAGLTYLQSHPPGAGSAVVGAAIAAPQADAATGSSRIELRMTLRRLFEERAAYTRNSIISAVANTPDFAAVNGRLMKNQEEIARTLRPFYGDTAAAKLTTLLKEEITSSGAALQASRSGGKAKLAAARQDWSEKSAAIAAFLSAANPSWQKGEMEQMLHKHVELTMREATARLLRDWPADIKAHDERHLHMLNLADTLANGIVTQFPARFAG